MKNKSGGDAVIKPSWIGEGEEVTGADVEVLGDPVGDAHQAFEIYITIVRTVQRGMAGDFEMEVDHAGGAAVGMRVVVSCMVFTEGFHQANSVNQFGFIGIETMFDGDDGVEGEIVSEVVPHGDTGSDGGVTAKIAATGWKDGFNLSGEQEAIGIDEKRAWHDGQIAESFGGADAFFVFKDVRKLGDDPESFGEGPFEFDFGFVFGEALAVQIGVIDEQIATRESRLNTEGVHIWSAILARVDVSEWSQKIRCEGCGCEGCRYDEG